MESRNNNMKIGFIGGGNMATAIISGLLNANAYTPEQIYVSHPSASKLKKFSHLKIENETDNNRLIVKTCDVIVLCVKPQILENVCKPLRDLIETNRHLIVSICAGISLKKLTDFLCSNESISLRIARCMLNTAALIRQSCSVFSQNGNLNEKDKNLIDVILSSVGQSMGEINDKDMDAAMAVCSCGIAYMFVMADAMADGGVKMGLGRDLALKLSFQTMKGASELMQSQFGRKHHMQLKDEVCSPGGTTISGIHELEKYGFRHSVISALEAATNKAKQF